MEAFPDAKFRHGPIRMTKSISEMVDNDDNFRKFIVKAISKYLVCNWGDTNSTDWYINDKAVRDNQRILAVYIYKPLKKNVWIVTEYDRSSTTVMFPEEY